MVGTLVDMKNTPKNHFYYYYIERHIRDQYGGGGGGVWWYVNKIYKYITIYENVTV